jgi:hypothetical protein
MTSWALAPALLIEACPIDQKRRFTLKRSAGAPADC